jgi:RNA polymerase sigma-70 factor (ECF subfamily)
MMVEGSQTTSRSLIDRVRAMEPQAWQRLCAIYGPLVYRWGRLAGLQDVDAADIGQEVFRTVAARIGDYRNRQPSGTFRAWLRAITRHKIGDLFRRRASHPAAPGGSAAWDQLHQLPASSLDVQADDPLADAGVLHRTLELIRQEFEPQTWQAFWLATTDELPAAEVAARLGTTPQAVRQSKYRVLRRLRQELADDELASGKL